jgi:hypothetical protein
LDETPYQESLRVIRETIASHRDGLESRMKEICRCGIKHTGKFVEGALDACPYAKADIQANRMDGAIGALRDAELTIAGDDLQTHDA